jgi:5'(3')-deoxyribonucleotidase
VEIKEMSYLLFLDMDGVIVDLPQCTVDRWSNVSFWENLSKLPWADDLVELCMRLYEVHILTTPAVPECVPGKMQWLHRWYPSLADGAIHTSEKYLLAQSNRVLVDDDPGHTSSFRTHGGEAVRVHNPKRFPFCIAASIESVFYDITRIHDEFVAGEMSLSPERSFE